MAVKLSLFKKIFLVLGMLFFCVPGFAQDYKKITDHIDSLVNIGLPRSALSEVNVLDKLARQNKNAAMQIKAAIYRMTFQSYIEENSIVPIIDTLKSDIAKASFPVKPVLQSVLAAMYYGYYQQNRWQLSQRTRLENPGADFTKWDLQTIIDEAARQYQLSLQDHEHEQNTPVDVLNDVLAGDKTQRYLRPTLYDLLVQRTINFFMADEPALTKPKQPFSLNNPLLFGDSRSFVNLHIQTTDTSSTLYKGIHYLQQATLFHLQKGDAEALANLDIQRLSFLYNKATFDDRDSLYLNALQQIAATFSSKPICTDALVLLGNYYKQKDSLKTAMTYFKKAVSLFPESVGGKNAAVSIKQIKERLLSVKVEETCSPGKPLLSSIAYRNIKTVKIFVYKVSHEQAVKINDYKLMRYSDHSRDTIVKILERFTAIQQQILQLPDPGDYHWHTAEFKIDPLTAGNYVMLVKELNGDSTMTNFGNFNVSHLAYASRINPDNHIQLIAMDRETGQPLPGVKLYISGERYDQDWRRVQSNQEQITERGTTNNKGSYTTKLVMGGNFSFELTAGNDTLIEPKKYQYGPIASTVNESNGRDRTMVFTDRQIYRPGQTIYFKVLETKSIKDTYAIKPYNDDEISLIDVNEKKTSTINFTTNEFGSYGGSFIIPQNMLNGRIILQTDNGSINVSVEEYKRPSFQVEFLPNKESHKLNDSITVKGRVTAFSGYGLSHVRVAWHITRTNMPVELNNGRMGYITPDVTEIGTDTINTDNQGNYIIKFKALSGKNSLKDVIYKYEVKADVTDATGETHSAQTAVTLGNPNIRINTFVPDRITLTDSVKLPVSITNLDMQQLAGNIKVEVYALQHVDIFFKKRLWSDPDQYLLSREEYKKYFPEYDYRDEHSFQHLPVLKMVEELNIKANASVSAIMRFNLLQNQPPGTYKVKINAVDSKGDTVSLTKFISVVTHPATPQNNDDWEIPVVTKVKRGQNARFFVGADNDSYALMEKYKGTEIELSKWLHIVNGQESIEVPVLANDSDISVQFLMVHQNRLYKVYEAIETEVPDQSLRLSFLTFRDKLQPGEKEQWKIRITDNNNEKENAEMLATLYDASLDNITPSQNWKDILHQVPRFSLPYFSWNYFQFINPATTAPVTPTSLYYNYITRNYEELNVMGYNYYGNYNYGYNGYRQRLNQKAIIAANDKRLEMVYDSVSALVKKGFEISGQVRDDQEDNLQGVVVRIKGTGLAVVTNSKGYFRIKVPENNSLVISFVGYDTYETKITKNSNLTIPLTASNSALHEMVVVAYGTQKRTSEADAAIALDEITGRTPGVRVVQLKADTVNYKSNIYIRGFTRLSGADFKPEDSPIATRKNFAETAFFYPQLHTDKNGEVLIDFTIPETLTKWRFKGFAHTKDLKTGYIEREIVTQKQLSINANMPRFLREGDTLTVSARLVNLTASALKGKAELQLFNSLNMQPVSLLLNKADAVQNFDIQGANTKAISFKITVPAGLQALTYRLTAESGKFTDGEENTLAVLPNRMLVTESMPMMVRPGQQREFTFDKLLNETSKTLQNKTLTLEYTQNPAWYAILALPYMMEFPYECSEQIFSRYYANSLATNLVNHTPAIKQVFDQWKNNNSPELLSNLEKNPELKSTLIEETPWLRDAENEGEQKKRIALLFDLNKMSYELQQNLDKLQKKQLPGGGFPWFGGDRADRYITQHILAGIGQLYHAGVTDPQNKDLKDIADNAMSYLDNELIDEADREKTQKTYENRTLTPIELHAWYIQSYFTTRTMSTEMLALQANYLKLAELQWSSKNMYEQAMIALTMLRNKKTDIAQMIIRSLKETAQQSDDMGMYWAKNQLGYYWYQSPIETQSLMIELFTEAGNNEKAVEEMKIWLLRNKQTNNWKTTKATAAACYALLMKGDDLLSDKGKSEIKVDGKALSAFNPDVKADAGTGYIKTTWTDEQIKPALGKVNIKNGGKTISWGALHWQYLENLDKITPSKTDIELERKYFIQKQTANGPVLTAIDAAHQPKTGDLLKVVVTLKAGRDFEYIHLKDMRPAGTEPVDVLSAYKYQDGLYYYQVTKDVATNFFISSLNKGNYVFEYSLRVEQPGNFSTGISTIESMYAPEYNAHSEGKRLVVKSQ